LTRFNFRAKIGDVTFFFMVAKTQTLEGVTSLQPDGTHIVLWDLENCTLKQAEETLRNVQIKYGLSHIYIASDTEGSYRAWCFSKVDYKTFLHILLDTEHLDPIFFDYTVKRKKATLRASNKKDRKPQELVSVIESYPAPFPKTWEKVTYDTGLVKRGRSILLGGD
jgi:hypothetical protein